MIKPHHLNNSESLGNARERRAQRWEEFSSRLVGLQFFYETTVFDFF